MIIRSASRLAWLTLVCIAGCAASHGVGPSATDEADDSLRFGLLTDVQYADKDTVGKRRYRDGLVNLASCIEDLNTHDLDFVVHCGDLIDGRKTAAETHEDLGRVLQAFSELHAPVHHVIGNHCLAVPRVDLMPRIGLSRGYHSFTRGDWRFIMVDALAFSTCGLAPEDPVHSAATQWLKENADSGQPNVQSWNGALGGAQRRWLEEELALAAQAEQHAVVFSHLPVLEESSTPHHLLWDHEEVLAVLDAAPAFAAWINGHDHAGGFAEHNQRAFVTLPGMVEADPAVNAYAIVDVYSDRLEISGTGNVTSRTILAP